jgi:hypothetical protein
MKVLILIIAIAIFIEGYFRPRLDLFDVDGWYLWYGKRDRKYLKLK